MRQGVSYASAREVSTITSSQPFDPLYPLANLLDLKEPRRTGRLAGNTGLVLTLSFSEVREISFGALVHHNAPAGAFVTMQAWAGVAGSGSPLAQQIVNVPARIDRPQNLPIKLPQSVMAASVSFLMPGIGATWELGGVEAGGWWDWSDIMVDRELGYASGASISDRMGGVKRITRQWSPMVSTGNLGGRTLEELEGVVLDFQAEKGLTEPFIWCRDCDDPSTWARECVLMRNNSLPAGVASDVLSGQASLAMIEHL